MAHPPEAREPIPGYVLQERIGVGGYGEVWSATAPGDLAKAVKLVYGHFDDERATRELKALKRIKEVRHPFLLSLERIEVIDGQLIIVTELADRSLKDRFEEVQAAGGCIPREELLGYMRDAADALDYMSDNFSLQHLDVKPENLLLVGNRVKVADFGLVKELQDVTASMMGGLTPVYASPEVFDGRPSQRSDQYSLAIVYQELLTGMLPFPGKTAAQLASQHVHARPRLASLPADDQPIIGRALSKDPNQRFVNCRELVDRLAGTFRSKDEQDDTEALKRPAESISDTTSVRSRGVATDPQWRKPGGPSEERPNVKTLVIGERSTAAGEEERPTSVTVDARSPAPLLPPTAPTEAAVDLPPLELEASETSLQPTLFLAVGGIATRTLRQLRGQLCDRLGASAQLPALQMLAIDTDARGLFQATQGDRETALAESETMTLPLRNARDYTSMSAKKLKTLSRRWLYNIPRSLQTEGRRPLGRLVFVDHADKLRARLRDALTEITSQEAISATSEATGLEFSTNVPRVVLIASTTGGTGSGMVLDLAYTVRTLLAELEQSDAALCGLLVHATDSNPTAADLAIANSYATLGEFFHYSTAAGYPGDEACGLPPHAGDANVFRDTYLVHLGDNLTDQDFDRGIDALASYLYLNAVTPAAGVFERFREQDTTARPGALRTIGLTRVGALRTPLPTLATEVLCREVVSRWRGAGQSQVKRHARVSLVDRAVATAATDVAAAQADRDTPQQQAETHAEQTGITLPKLLERSGQLVQAELGGDPAEVLAHMCESAPSGCSVHSLHYLQHALSALERVFGPADPAASASTGAPTPIQSALEDKLKQVALPQGATAGDWILGLVDAPRGGVAAAATAKQWYDGNLKAIESEAQDQARKKQMELLAGERALRAAVAAPRKRSFFGRQESKSDAEITKGLVYLVTLRCQKAAAEAVVRMCRLIGAPLSAAGDRISDLKRELGLLLQQFSGKLPWSDDEEPIEAGDVSALLAESIRQRVGELVPLVDQLIHEHFLQPEGGLRSVLERADNLRDALVHALRVAARVQVLQALQSTALDVPAASAESDALLEWLRSQLVAALPCLDRCGGQRRLIAVTPQASADSPLVASLQQQLEPPPTVVVDTDPDLVLCYESQGLWAPYVGGRLIGDRGDLVPIASRLHTRSDVSWFDLAAATPPEAAACTAEDMATES